jgi:hypothetical protein
MTGLCVIYRAYKQVRMGLCLQAFDGGSVVNLTKYVIRLETPVLPRNGEGLALCMEAVSFNKIWA